MSGFVYGGNTYKIAFEEGHDLYGLEVKLRSASVGRFLEITRTAGEGDKTQDAVESSLRLLAEHLVSWNLEMPDDDGVPQKIPATYDGLLFLPIDALMTIVNAWTERIASVPSPLERKPESGLKRADLEGSLPMETLSPAPLNSGNLS